MGLVSSVVLSALEFDVLWESQRFAHRNVVLDVPSPGVTHTERAVLVQQAWAELEQRGIARGGVADPELVDGLALLAESTRSVDCWLWSDREVRALAAATEDETLLAVVDGDEVQLIPQPDNVLAEAAISLIEWVEPGPGRSVSVSWDLLRAADAEVEGDPQALVSALTRRGVRLVDAQLLGKMFTGITARGQFGFEHRDPYVGIQRAERIIAFHDTDQGRYLSLVRDTGDGQAWATVTPADNAALVRAIQELIDEA